MAIELYEWQYDEMKQIGTDYNNIEEIEKYDERMSKFRDFNEEIGDMLDFLELSENSSIVEFGCGTGRSLIASAEIAREAVGVDVSSLMLEYVEKRAKEANLENIQLVHGGFINYSHEGEEVDAVVSQLALHHLPDFWKMIALKRIFDIMKIGGKLYLRDVVFSIPIEKYQQKIDGFLKWTAESAGEENASNYSRHIRQEFSTYDWMMEEMLYRAGFYIEKAEYNDSFIAVYKCVKPKSLDL